MKFKFLRLGFGFCSIKFVQVGTRNFEEKNLGLGLKWNASLQDLEAEIKFLRLGLVFLSVAAGTVSYDLWPSMLKYSFPVWL